jgi:hypothetical protein
MYLCGTLLSMSQDPSLDDTSLVPITAPMRSIVQSKRHRPYLDLGQQPPNRSAGLLCSDDGRIIYLGQLLRTPVRLLQLHRPDWLLPFYHQLLNHFAAYARNPWVALSQYSHDLAAALYQARVDDDDLMYMRLNDEDGLWRKLYTETLADVFRHVEMSEDPEDHMWWTGPYPDSYASRPRIRISGHDYTPVYRMLWPLFRSDYVLPLGRPKKDGKLCGDTFSPDPARNFKLCVNPRHFERPLSFEQRILAQHTRRGLANEILRCRWPLSQITTHQEQGVVSGYCPKGHHVPATVLQRYEGGTGSARFTCTFCKEDANRQLELMGRTTPRTRARHEPTLAELDMDHQLQVMQRPGYKPGLSRQEQDKREIANEKMLLWQQTAEERELTPEEVELMAADAKDAGW